MISLDPIKVLYSDFDIETHQKTFIDYLEVVILRDGTVEYAVPSHIRKLERLCDCPVPSGVFFGDYMGWLMENTGAICVWSDFYTGKANAIQKRKLCELFAAGLFNGKIHHEPKRIEVLA